jgi:hypothetical protein
MGMMTIVEYAKGMGSNPQRPFIEMFAKSSDIFEFIGFSGMSGPVYEGTRTASLPSPAFRGINEGASSGAGRVTTYQEASYIIDHHIDIDAAIVRRQGEQRRNQQRQMLIASAGRKWVDTFIAGDNSSEPREFNGIKTRSALLSRATANSAASGGAALSLLKLDQVLNAVNKQDGRCAIIVPYDSIPLWIGAARNTSISGFVIQTWDQVGMPKMTYRGIPFLIGYEKDDHTPVLQFNEVAEGGGSAVTASLYVVNFGESRFHGVQHKDLTCEDKGLLEDGITLRDHLSWDVGQVDDHKYCLHRLHSWTNAAIVA